VALSTLISSSACDHETVRHNNFEMTQRVTRFDLAARSNGLRLCDSEISAIYLQSSILCKKTDCFEIKNFFKL